MTRVEDDPSHHHIGAMDFLAGPSGLVIPAPDQLVESDHLARTQTALSLFRGNLEQMAYFKRRAAEIDLSGRDAVIALINADDPIGSILADGLMPGHDWQRYRDAGEVPVARGLAGKDGVYEFLVDAGYRNAARELAATEDLRVVVLDAGVALVLEVGLGE